MIYFYMRPLIEIRLVNFLLLSEQTTVDSSLPPDSDAFEAPEVQIKRIENFVRSLHLHTAVQSSTCARIVIGSSSNDNLRKRRWNF